jgi:hypothetical protein
MAGDARRELDLSDLLTAVRAELDRHERGMRAEGRLELFELQEMELEVAFVVTSDRKRGSKLDFKLLAVSADAGAASSTTHRLTLKYKVSDEARALDTPGQRAHSSSTTRKRGRGHGVRPIG